MSKDKFTEVNVKKVAGAVLYDMTRVDDTSLVKFLVQPTRYDEERISAYFSLIKDGRFLGVYLDEEELELLIGALTLAKGREGMKNGDE